MLKNIKTSYLLFYFIFSLFFMEFVFRLLTTDKIFSFGIFISLLFSSTVALVFFFICSLFKNKVSYILSIILLSLAGFIFVSQLVYFKFFRTFYTLYSAGNAGQVFEFWEDIWTLILRNFLWILVIFLPVIFFIIFGRKLFNLGKVSNLTRGILVSSMIATQVLGITTVYVSGHEQHSAYDLYFKSSYPTLSTERLGLLTTMRLDLQRLVTGWSPVLEASNPYLPEDPGENEQDPVLEPEKETDNDRTGNAQKEPKKEEKIEYNIIDIDFEKLIAEEENEELLEMHQYFKNVPPTAKNEHTGKFEGYNLIFITAEGFSPYAVHPEATPTLYKLVHEGYQFTNFYNPLWGVSTSDGEYVATQSLIPKSGVWSFSESSDNWLPFVMGNQLKKLGYKTVAYHNHSYTYYDRHLSHPNLGYDYKGVGNGLQVRQTWPESDLEMMEVTAPEYVNEEPFHAYYMTVSGHMQYSFSGNVMARKNQEVVKDLPYSEQAKAYIATQVELDRGLEHLIGELEKAGVMDNTLIALSADHYPYGLENETINELAGHTVEKEFELYKSPFILYTKNMEPEIIEKPSSSLDIIPTLSNLLGLDYDSRLLMGTDIFSDAEPVVPFLSKSFITAKGKYNALTQEFIPNEGMEVDEEYIEFMKAVVQSKFYYSTKILETNYYQEVLPK
jgi:lipoteichoic acid synthase